SGSLQTVRRWLHRSPRRLRTRAPHAHEGLTDADWACAQQITIRSSIQVVSGISRCDLSPLVGARSPSIVGAIVDPCQCNHRFLSMRLWTPVGANSPTVRHKLNCISPLVVQEPRITHTSLANFSKSRPAERARG